jgi:hypothetical protein
MVSPASYQAGLTMPSSLLCRLSLFRRVIGYTVWLYFRFPLRGCPKRPMPTHILAFPEEVRDGETVWNGHERCGVGSG